MNKHRNGKYVAYFRVSTDRQGRSGLGLEAQQRAVLDYVEGGGWSLVASFTEVESGRRNDRPKLAKALAACRAHRATLLVAKFDRLARNVHFISGLMESGVDFAACDMPEANKLTIHVIAAVAEHEREAISRRTKEALQAAKARGVRLGNPGNMDAGDRARGRALGREARTRAARAWAEDVLPVIEEIRAAGTTSLHGIAAALNRSGTPARRGGRWQAAQVRRVLALADGDAGA